MKTWIVCGLLGVCGGAALLVSQSQPPAPPAAPAAPAAPATSPAASIPPAAGPDVTDVVGIDHLLDPPAIPVAAGQPPAPVVLSVSADHAPAARAAVPAELPRAAD